MAVKGGIIVSLCFLASFSPILTFLLSQVFLLSPQFGSLVPRVANGSG